MKIVLHSGKKCACYSFPIIFMSPETIQETIALAEEYKCKYFDLTLVDVPGTLNHTSKPIHELNEVLENGAGFDGSSIRGFQAIQESDMLLIPDPKTAIIDRFAKEPTLSIICDVKDPFSGQGVFYNRSPRTVARKAIEYLQKSGLADTAYFGPEAEFFIFDYVSYDVKPGGSYFEVDSIEAAWNTGDEGMGQGPNLGYQIRHKHGYFPAAPADKHQDLRAAMVTELEAAGIEIETFHHEVATAGQAEIDMKYDDLLSMSDKLVRYKYITRNVAYQHGKTVTFMPKPIFADNGSGMHTHMSLWKDGQPLFAGDKYAGLSDMALYFMGGLIKHANALCAVCNPTTNSYKRMVPGFEAPVNFIYSARNRSAAIRIPTYSQNPKSKRVEFRAPDPSCNPYLAFAAMLLAGLDGVQNKIDPGEATDESLYSMSPEKLSRIPHAPSTLDEALDALEKDQAFLLNSGAFNKEFIEDFITLKREEVAEERSLPTAGEYARYFDV